MAVKVVTANDVFKYTSGTYWTIDHNEHLTIRTETGKSIGTIHRNEWLSVCSTEDEK